eukprot:CAMPEP_0174309258 /NCGR_PEP_ID=MMETSP0810-20121108/2290_1 /TAXON_ID=73025 ORGANISM="Eutreptiella gymnastica-like, Strain CCMP1594" /NCGR_SAMPLE_ID=MMETSP0810 /ASSEMBLY_ACC=CAM_ASM_000659 /LENGTH=773 /DNA_ID=CAMNT_0015416831 /DNA_START=250 /DNA_END=2571 /DNA_ORIENTATION=+
MVFAFNFSILSWRTVYNPAALTRAVVPQDSFCMAVDAERMQLWSLGATSAYLQLNVPENSKVEWKTFNTISDGDGEKAYVPVLRDFPATVTCDHWVFLFGGERNNAAAHTPLGLDLSTDITRPDLNIADLQPQAFFSDLLSFNFDTQCWSCHNISEGPCDPSTDRPSTIFNALSQMDNLQYYATGQDPGQTSPSTMINTDQPEPWDAVEFKRQKFKSPIKRALLAPTGVEKTVTDNSSHVPIWKRETRPQKPDKAPDYDMYYETKPGPREQSRAGTESRRKVKDESKRAARQLHQMLHLQHEEAAARQKPRSTHKKSRALNPETLGDLLEGATPTNILHSLLHEKYQFDKEKAALTASAAASQEEVLAYDKLLDHVISEYMTKTNVIAASAKSPEIRRKSSFVRKQRELMASLSNPQPTLRQLRKQAEMERDKGAARRNKEEERRELGSPASSPHRKQTKHSHRSADDVVTGPGQDSGQMPDQDNGGRVVGQEQRKEKEDETDVLTSLPVEKPVVNERRPSLADADVPSPKEPAMRENKPTVLDSEGPLLPVEPEVNERKPSLTDLRDAKLGHQSIQGPAIYGNDPDDFIATALIAEQSLPEDTALSMSNVLMMRTLLRGRVEDDHALDMLVAVKQSEDKMQGKSDQEAAATRIQAMQRRRKVRQNFNTRLQQNREGIAATKIQAFERGRRGRQKAKAVKADCMRDQMTTVHHKPSHDLPETGLATTSGTVLHHGQEMDLFKAQRTAAWVNQSGSLPVPRDDAPPGDGSGEAM